MPNAFMGPPRFNGKNLPRGFVHRRLVDVRLCQIVRTFFFSETTSHNIFSDSKCPTKASISAQVRAFIKQTQEEIAQEHPGLPEEWARKHWIAKQGWNILVNCEVKAPPSKRYPRSKTFNAKGWK